MKIVLWVGAVRYVTGESSLPLMVLEKFPIWRFALRVQKTLIGGFARFEVRVLFYCTLAVASPPSPPSPMLNFEHRLAAALELTRGMLDSFNIGYRGVGGRLASNKKKRSVYFARPGNQK